MNGSVHPLDLVQDIVLPRGPAGFGFNIVGGVDQPYVLDDSGIYVVKIKEAGTADVDGRLREGDKILEINDVKVENWTHRAVVELFKQTGEQVKLKVFKKHQHHGNGRSHSQPDDTSSYPGVLVALAGVAVLVSFIYIRNKHF